MLLRAMIGLVFVYHSILPGRPPRSVLGNQVTISLGLANHFLLAQKQAP
jgi:hypothetical protein